MSSARHERIAVLSLLASGMIWGLAWLPLKYFAAQGLDGLGMVLATYGLVGVLAAPVIWMQRGAWWPQRRLLVLAGLLGGAANTCFITALMFGEVVRVMLLFYLAPLWGVASGWLLLGERLTSTRVLGMASAIAGAVLLLGGTEILGRPLALADLLGMGSGLFYALTNVATRAGSRIPLASKSLTVFTGCAVVAGVLVPVLGARFPALPAPAFLLLLGFALLWLPAAMWTTMYGVTHLEAGRSSVLLVFELVAAVVSAMAIGGERLTGIEWVGALLILGAALLEARPTSTPQENPA